jgi:hypothetical protein
MHTCYYDPCTACHQPDHNYAVTDRIILPRCRGATALNDPHSPLKALAHSVRSRIPYSSSPERTFVVEMTSSACPKNWSSHHMHGSLVMASGRRCSVRKSAGPHLVTLGIHVAYHTASVMCGRYGMAARAVGVPRSKGSRSIRAHQDTMLL